MVEHFQQQESLLQNPIFDVLYCDEERFDEDLCSGFGLKEPKVEDFNQIHKNPSVFLFEHDLFWEDGEIVSLLSKEKKQEHLCYDGINSDGSLKMTRNEGIKWILKREKPWMSQLTAVACLSIAAKVEETQVPVLADFQVEESKYMFEAKTIQRMEVLVLFTLQWKMNPATPISFFNHIVRRFGLITNLHCEVLRLCESIILSIITDCRLVDYLPSVIAAATMKYVIREIDPCGALEYQNQLMSALRTSKEKVEDCHKLIKEVMDDHGRNLGHKRRHECIPSSPSGVIDTYFSSDSSNNSWSVTSSMSSSPEPLSKRSKSQDQHIRLAPLSTVSVGVVDDPR